MSCLKTRRVDLLCCALLLIVGALLYMPFTGTTALTGAGESRSAEIARQMYLTGDYLVPHLNGRVALTKPPLYHWLAALSYRVLGVTEFAARLPSGVAGTLMLVTTFLLGRRLIDRRAGMMAALMTATSVEFFTNAHMARTDVVFALCVAASVTAFVYAATSPSRSSWMYIPSFALAGLAVLAKGPAGLILPGVSALAMRYFTRGLPDRPKVPWLAGVLVFSAVATPWYVAAALSVNRSERSFFIWGQLAQWLSGSDEPVARFKWSGVLEYVPYTLKGFFPWSFMLPAGVVLAWRAVARGRNRALGVVLAWLIAGVVFFSASNTKAARYMLPMFAPAAVMVAYLWRAAFEVNEGAGADALSKGAHKWLLWSLRPLVVMAVACAAFMSAGPAVHHFAASSRLLSGLNSADSHMVDVWLRFVSANQWLFVAATIALAAVAGLALRAARANHPMRAFSAITAISAAGLCVFQFVAAPRIDGVYNVRPFLARFGALNNDRQYAWAGPGALETIFYLRRDFDAIPADGVRDYLQANPDNLVLMWDKDYDALPGDVMTYPEVVLENRFKHRRVMALAAPGWSARQGLMTLPTQPSAPPEAEDNPPSPAKE